MALRFHPRPGTILVCDYNTGFRPPEMVKRRPVVVVSPPISVRARLCTVVPISTEVPAPVMPYHCELSVELPRPWHEGPNWVKADMISAVSFERLDLIRTGRDEAGKRIYFDQRLGDEEFMKIRKCILNALGMAALTKHLG